jgi:hypothetical protein
MLKKLLLCGACFVMSGAVRAGTVQPLTNPAPEGTLLTFLLTDGRVLAQSDSDTHFYTLTPDNTGSYANGTWAKAADLPRNYAPYAGASAVLGDGRVLLIGGEYNFGLLSLTNLGAIYDPQANKWTNLKPPPGKEWAYIGDSAGLVLPDGRYLLGDKLNKAIAAYDPKTGRWTNLKSTGKSDFNAEEGWTLLPDGRVFTVDVKNQPNSEIYDPATQTWTSAGNTGVDLVYVDPKGTKIIFGDHQVYHPPGEVGASMLLPDGSVFTAGSVPRHEKTAHSAIYKDGVWSAGPDIPNGDDASDVASVLLPSGHVLQETFGHTYEFDGTEFKKEPFVGESPLLLLPTGQVLVSGTEIYTGRGRPKRSWEPTINAFPATVARGSSYQISGTQFNGLSQANALGDELETFTNYPLVRITNNASGHVIYARTHDHSTMGVATGKAIVSTNFDVPAAAESGASSLVVVANGISSRPVSITVN